MSKESTELALDDAFNILSNSRRRYILYYLYTRDEPATIEELASQIAAWENDIPVDDLDDTARRRVYVSLYQTHLPKLDDFGIAVYDRDEGTVRLTEKAEEIVRYLPVERRETPQFTWYYVVLTAGAVIALLGTAFGLPPFAVVPGTLIALAFAIALLALVVYQYALTRRSEDDDLMKLEDLE
ncbi:hypothetical protein ACFQPA_21270 [Halomarina halobia]|uniref:DUF7344 domain-containing protein n=1 Tax=Halomarina halobia TaxID=3033386 RepID=A0ABD6AH36_9EURY|nr:hypothetical protein [Halomarina sp. PSR21]